jgi:LPXTG-motif cell wall-anchored protein
MYDNVSLDVDSGKLYDIKYRAGLGYSENELTAIGNPYKGNYNYVDGAYFGTLSTEDLHNIFDEILDKVQIQNKYDFLLKDDTSLVMTDPIGYGMEVKGDPVLRYFGKNYYNATKTTGTDGNTTYTDYCWKETAQREDSDAKIEERDVDISTIVARVTTNVKSGAQSVTLTVPDNVLPVYYPDLNRNFYYEELPVRLIYRVGLSESQEQALKDRYDTDKYVDETYYTNRYSSGKAGTTVTFEPVESDPYYKNYNLIRKSVVNDKNENTTDTVAYSFSESYDSSTGVVTQLLGNNGKLNINKDDTISINVKKKWADDDINHPTTVYVALIVKGTQKDADGNTTPYEAYKDAKALNTSNNWEYTWEHLKRDETIKGVYYTYDQYFVSEFTPDSYTAFYADGDGNALSQSTEKYTYTYLKQVDSNSVNAMSVDDESADSTTDSAGEIIVKDKNGNPVYIQENKSDESENGDDVSISPYYFAGLTYETVTEEREIDAVDATRGEVVITNLKSYELPYTGGSREIVTFSAITLMLGALLMYIFKRRKEMRS